METLQVKITPSVDRFAITQDVEALINIAAPCMTENSSTRTPIDLGVIADVSGSMTPHMLLLSQSLQFVVEQLGPNDRFFIVSFSTEPKLIFPFSNMDGAAKLAAIEVCKNLASENSTFLSGGLFMGCDEMTNDISRRPADRVSKSSLFLMTDGEATDGLVNLEEIINVLRKRTFRENCRVIPVIPVNPQLPRLFPLLIPELKHDPIPDRQIVDNANHKLGFNISTFGFGPTHNETLLRGIADMGNGMYTFVQNDKGLPAAFADALGGLLTTTAQDITCVISPSKLDMFTIDSVRGGQSVVQKDGVFTVSFADLQSGEKRDLIVKLRQTDTGRDVITLATLDGPTNSPLLNVTVNYKNMLHQNEAEVVTGNCSVQFDTDEGLSHTPARRSSDFDVQLMRLQVVEALEKANRLAATDRAAAFAHLRSYSSQVNDMMLHQPSDQYNSMSADLSQAIDTLATQPKSVASKTMTSLSMQHSQQRSSTTSAVPSAYSNQYKTQLAEASASIVPQRWRSAPPSSSQQ